MATVNHEDVRMKVEPKVANGTVDPSVVATHQQVLYASLAHD